MKVIPTKEQLEELYVRQGLPIRYVAEKLGASKATVTVKLHEYGIPVKPKGRIYGPGADEYRRRGNKPKPLKNKSSAESFLNPLLVVHTGGRVEGNYWDNLEEFEAEMARSRARVG